MSLPLAEYTHLLGAYLKPLRSRVSLLAALALAGIGLQLLNPQVIRYFIDTAQIAGAARALLLAAAAYLGIGLAERGISFATTYVSLQVGWAATDALRGDLARHVLRLDMPFHKTHTAGELIERVDGDVTSLADFFAQFVVRTASNLLLVAGILLLLFREDVRAGAILAAYALVTVAALAALQNFGATRWTAARQAWAELTGFLEEHIAGSEDIRGVGAEGYALGKLQRALAALLRQARGGWMANALGFSVTQFLYVIGYGLGLAIGATLYTEGTVTIGTAFVIVYYVSMTAAPLDAIREQAKNLQQATAGIGRVAELFHLRPQVVETPAARLPGGALAVAFDRVAFAYDDEGRRTDDEHAPRNTQYAIPNTQYLALDQISFLLAPSRILGVLGRTGSGKTTLTRLLFRLYDPAVGAIRLGGVDLREVAFADLRDRVGMVTQDVQLFGASVRDNIALFDPAVGDEQMRHALGELGLLDWAEMTLGGLDAELAPAAAGLSAGEAQLLAFTRVLLRDPGLIILDEAASRLDPITEARLERAIDRLLGKTAPPAPQSWGVTDSPKVGGRGASHPRTGIIIAHRLRTVQRADDILILEAGRVVEFGPREQLASDRSSRFYSLLQTGLEEALA
ncbi:MAG: ABC transporter ATP-binding protein [Chloroflexi bacterium]|nr:ABC transporter ATP-binding protein [Chloroflexota bacterium]